MVTMTPTLIDVHSHFVTPSYVEAACAAGHTHPDGMPAWPEWSAAAHLDLMDQADIATSILSVSSPGTHFGDDAVARALTLEVNEFAADLRRDHPERFGHFASLPLPDVDGALEAIGYALDELGSDGVTVLTNSGGRYLGEDMFEPVWAELNRRRAAVFVHPTSPPGHELVSSGRPRPMMEFLFDSARAVVDLVFAKVLLRHPDIRWIITHGGGALPLLVDRIELFRLGFSGADPQDPATHDQLRRLWFDMAGTPFPRQIPAASAVFGDDKLLYGSDYCWTPGFATLGQVSAIDNAPQTDGDTWRALTTRNAERLIPRLV